MALFTDILTVSYTVFWWCVLGFFIYCLVNVLYFINDIRKCLNISKALAGIPCPVRKRHWLKGSMADYDPSQERGLMQQSEWLKTYPFYYAIDYGCISRYVVLNHPSTAKLVLKRSDPKISKSFGWTYNMLRYWLGDSLAMQTGETWSRNRRLLTPAFHFEILKGYVQVYNEKCNRMIAHIKSPNCIYLNDTGSFDVNKLTEDLSLQILLECAFSFDENAEKMDQKAKACYSENILSLERAIFKRFFNPLYMFDWVYFNTKDGRDFMAAVKLAREFPRKVMEARRRALDQNMVAERKYRDFMDILLLARDEDGNSMTDKEISDEVQLFMLAGLTSTASTMSFFLYNMARHVDIQDNVRAEIDQLLGTRESNEINFADLPKLPYLVRCIKESMRLHPTALFATGRELAEPLRLDDYVLPVGTPVEINAWNLHHNPLVWGDDHMTYNPDRFNRENIINMDPFAFVPFSAGPRNCLGQTFAMNEMKVVLAKILHDFTVSLDSTCKYELEVRLTLAMKNGMYLTLKPLHSSP